MCTKMAMQDGLRKVAKIGHTHESKKRTEDIKIDEHLSFKDLGLQDEILQGLHASGFVKPSPIQLYSIPVGRCGLDLVIQAKSGTGKTCAFSTIALDCIDISIKRPQVLILTPTREISVQIVEVIKSISDKLKVDCYTAIGGLPFKRRNNPCQISHIVVGTPGRVKQLIELSVFDCQSIRLMILDEADKLLDESFHEQINWIYKGLPDSKQVIAASATYTDKLVEHLVNYMHNPTFIRLNSNDPVLLGVRQYVKIIEEGSLPIQSYNNKCTALISILSQLQFQQCLVFSNLQSRAENLAKSLASKGWPATHIAGSQDQLSRIEAISQLKSYNCRILISTDLTSRGIDADRIDLVINLDLPYDHETYLHRVGRAGRFGAAGAAITIIFPSEQSRLENYRHIINTNIVPLPETVPHELISQPLDTSTKHTVQIESFQILSNRPTCQRDSDSSNQPQSTDNTNDESAELTGSGWSNRVNYTDELGDEQNHEQVGVCSSHEELSELGNNIEKQTDDNHNGEINSIQETVTGEKFYSTKNKRTENIQLVTADFDKLNIHSEYPNLTQILERYQSARQWREDNPILISDKDYACFLQTIFTKIQDEFPWRKRERPLFKDLTACRAFIAERNAKKIERQKQAVSESKDGNCSNLKNGSNETDNAAFNESIPEYDRQAYPFQTEGDIPKQLVQQDPADLHGHGVNSARKKSSSRKRNNTTSQIKRRMSIHTEEWIRDQQVMNSSHEDQQHIYCPQFQQYHDGYSPGATAALPPYRQPKAPQQTRDYQANHRQRAPVSAEMNSYYGHMLNRCTQSGNNVYWQHCYIKGMSAAYSRASRRKDSPR